MFCREQTVQVHRAQPEIREAGAQLTVIGNGHPRFIADFRRNTDYDGRLLTDPSREAYRACGFAHGFRSTINLKSVRRAFRTYSNGFRQGRTQGDAWQQGGALVVAPPGRVLAVERSSHAGEHASVEALIDAVRAADRQETGTAD